MKNSPTNEQNWFELGLCEKIVHLTQEVGYQNPTAVQKKCVPIILQGQDVIVSAKTGSGKTASFCLPIIESFIGRKGTYGLILCPTREIALQTQDTIRIFGGPMGVSAVALIGGVDFNSDEEALSSGPQILVGTPGRICDHIKKGNLWLEFIEIFVLDEADRMLDMGFAKELSLIMEQLPKNRQTLLFSATIPNTLEHLVRKTLKNPVRVTLGDWQTAPKSVQQEILWVEEEQKKTALLNLLDRIKGPILIFVSTKDKATKIWRFIQSSGFRKSTFLSSNKTQEHREEALEGFRQRKYEIMVATDVAGRGIHIDGVALVLNYDLPKEPEEYLHRIGRTGRQNLPGHAISFVSQREKRWVYRLEEFQKQRFQVLSFSHSNRSYSTREGEKEKGRRDSYRNLQSRPPRHVSTSSHQNTQDAERIREKRRPPQESKTSSTHRLPSRHSSQYSQKRQSTTTNTEHNLKNSAPSRSKQGRTPNRFSKHNTHQQNRKSSYSPRYHQQKDSYYPWETQEDPISSHSNPDFFRSLSKENRENSKQDFYPNPRKYRANTNSNWQNQERHPRPNHNHTPNYSRKPHQNPHSRKNAYPNENRRSFRHSQETSPYSPSTHASSRHSPSAYSTKRPQRMRSLHKSSIRRTK